MIQMLKRNFSLDLVWPVSACISNVHRRQPTVDDMHANYILNVNAEDIRFKSKVFPFNISRKNGYID